MREIATAFEICFGRAFQPSPFSRFAFSFGTSPELDKDSSLLLPTARKVSFSEGGGEGERTSQPPRPLEAPGGGLWRYKAPIGTEKPCTHKCPGALPPSPPSYRECVRHYDAGTPGPAIVPPCPKVPPKDLLAFPGVGSEKQGWSPLPEGGSSGFLALLREKREVGRERRSSEKTSIHSTISICKLSLQKRKK